MEDTIQNETEGEPHETVVRSRVAEAYDKWCEAKGKAERGSGVSSDKLFVDAIYLILDAGHRAEKPKLGIPNTRSGWGNWRNRRGEELTKLHLDVCLAIKVLTNVDVTANQRLTSEPANATDFVRLGPANIRRPSASKGDEPVEISLEWIDFKVSAAKDVTRAHSRKSPTSHDKTRRIGNVRFALFEASMFVEYAQHHRPSMKNCLVDTEDKPSERATVELYKDREANLRWRAMPADNRAVLNGGLDDLVLSEGILEPKRNQRSTSPRLATT